MSFIAKSVLRTATRAQTIAMVRPVARQMSEELSAQDFDAKWKSFFADESIDEITIRRGLNDLFAHDLVPEPEILAEALKACRRVNDFSTTIRIFEGVEDKSPDSATYQYVVDQLKPVVDELGLALPKELGL